MKRLLTSITLVSAVAVAGMLSACDDTQPAGIDLFSMSGTDIMAPEMVIPELATDPVITITASDQTLTTTPDAFVLASLPTADMDLPASQQHLWHTPFLTPDPRAPDKV